MKITLASYHTIMLRHGGPQTQILQSKKHLEEMGLQVKLLNIWDSRNEILSTDLFHLFGANHGMYDLAGYLNDHNIPYVVTPIYFTRKSAGAVRKAVTLTRAAGKAVRGFLSVSSIMNDICRWATHILPNTSAEAALIRDSFDISEDRITVIPNGVEPRFSEATPHLFEEKYDLRDFVLNVGHVGPDRKNILTLIQALKEINRPAVIIGRVHPTPEAKKCLAEAKKNPNITIIEGLDHDDPTLMSAYAACDVFALPSKFETPGIAAMEAALAGAKIVITPHGGTKDYFDDFVTYVDPYSKKAITAGLNTALEKSKDNTLSQHIMTNFLWEHSARKMKEAYTRILQQL
ncbi:MAG: glycosyltransferase [Fidelibacterota bacterium]